MVEAYQKRPTTICWPLPRTRPNEDDVKTLFDKMLEASGTVDAPINTVGMNIVTGTVDAHFGVWKKIVDSNLNGAFLCSRRAGQTLKVDDGDTAVSI